MWNQTGQSSAPGEERFYIKNHIEGKGKPLCLFSFPRHDMNSDTLLRDNVVNEAIS